VANKIIVGRVRGVSSTPTDRFPDAYTYEFDNGQSASVVAPDAPGGPAYTQVLRELQTVGGHAYVEVDPDTNAIHNLLLPLEGGSVRIGTPLWGRR
jgi:hypothetical protein